MGIPGLMSYILKHGRLMNNYRLHGGYLVIDGKTLAVRLYINMNNCCAFGGDYDQYARVVIDFFEKLEKCEVTPIVVSGGGTELKTLNKRLDESKEVLKKDVSYDPQSMEFIRPFASGEVFFAILRKKKIKVYQCLAERNLNAVELAKIFKCPLLGFDSDFFMHDISFIPCSTLENSVKKNMRGRGYVIHCKIFKLENLLKVFPGLDRHVVALATVLLGKIKFVEEKSFDNFFHSVELETESSHEVWNWKHRRICAMFHWLSKRSLNDAVEAILQELPEAQHSLLINAIEHVINDHAVFSDNTLTELGLEEKCEQRMLEVKERKLFRFKDNMDSLKSKKLLEEDECIARRKKDIEENFAELPSWFCKEYNAAFFTPSTIRIICGDPCIFCILIENFDYPSVHSLSFRIVRVLHGLLVAGSKKFASKLTLIMREGRDMVTHQFEEPLKGTTTTLFPVLKKLRNTDMKLRKSIIDDTLEVAEMDEIFEDVPIKWRLYLAVIHFWVKNSPEPKVNECHILAILISMLFNIIDDKIGYERSLGNFRNKYYQTRRDIQARRRNSPPENSRISFDSLEEALRAVTNEDCLLAAWYFITHFAPDQEVINRPHYFDINVVHVFTGFQSLCKNTLLLNRLLGQPYDNFSFSEVFNGTLLYNLYKDLSHQKSPSRYVTQTFHQCPIFLSIVNLLYRKVVGVTIFDDNLVDAQVFSGYRK